MMSPLTEANASQNTTEIQQSLRMLDRKGWWHCWNAVLVMMLLTGAVAALSLPHAASPEDSSYYLELSLAVRGLLGLILIFNTYAVYQQHLLKGLRQRLATQIQIAAEQKARADAFYEMAILDPLTGLYNRRFGEEYLRTEVARTKRTFDPLAVAMLDLNHFKDINDEHGHFEGDLVLQEFARRLKRATRGSDIAVRMGGDEFLVILPECPPEKVEMILSRLGTFEVESDGKKISVSSSSGWAQYLRGESIEDLIKRADAALYAQKLSHGAQNILPLVEKIA